MYASADHILRTIGLYVGDITIAIMGPQRKIVESAVAVLSSLVSSLETMDLTPAKHKMTITSTSSHFGKQV
eukprot:7319323-Pyramimonas_sp.AAC.1